MWNYVVFSSLWKRTVKSLHWEACHKHTQGWWSQNTLHRTRNVAAAEYRTEGMMRSNTVGGQKWRWATAGLWSTTAKSGGDAGATTWPRTAGILKTTKSWISILKKRERDRFTFFPLLSGRCEYFIVFGLLCAYIVLCIVLLFSNCSQFHKRENIRTFNLVSCFMHTAYSETKLS